MSDKAFTNLVVLGLVLLVIGAGLVGWMRASTQAAVWQREGIQISTWEVLWGAKPNERIIDLKTK